MPRKSTKKINAPTTQSYVSNQVAGENKIAMSGSNLTPRLINTFFLIALQKYFLSHPEYTWSPRGEETQIDIHVEYEEDDNIQKAMPIVVVQTGPISIRPAGVGTGMAHLDPRVFMIGTTKTALNAFLDSHLQFLVDGSIILNVSGMTNDDVSELAFEIATFLLMIKYDAASILQLQNVGDIQITPVQAVEKVGWNNRHACQIIVPFVFTITRIWKPINPGVLMQEAQVALHSKVMGSKSQDSVTVPDNRFYQPGDKIPERKELSKEDLVQDSTQKTE